MPRRTGLELLDALREIDSNIAVILLTAQGTVESAVEAIRSGAYDYLTKPVDPQRLRILLDKAAERQYTHARGAGAAAQLRDQGAFGKMIGASPEMRRSTRSSSRRRRRPPRC